MKSEEGYDDENADNLRVRLKDRCISVYYDSGPVTYQLQETLFIFLTF
jgi:hypothetical protein